MDRSGHAQRMRGRGAACSARVDGGEQLGLSSMVCGYLAFPNILDPHGQRSNALEHAGRLAELRDSAVAVGAFRRVIRAA